MSPVLERIGGAPISWGVCEAPDWGYELPPDRVLDEMRELGLRATELGPTGYLGQGPEEVLARLGRHGLRLIGGFLPVPHARLLGGASPARPSPPSATPTRRGPGRLPPGSPTPGCSPTRSR